jgi:DNA-binding NarL/FixJ family response regulator
MFRDGIELILRDTLQGWNVRHANDQVELGASLGALLSSDLAIVSSSLPGGDTTALLKTLKRASPPPAILISDGDLDERETASALRGGIRGFIERDVTRDLARLAIQLVLAGGVYLPPRMVNGLLMKTARQEAISPVGASPRGQKDKGLASVGLSAREKEILECLAGGMSNRAIAESVDLEMATVKSHVHSIMSKLKVSNRTQAALKAVNLGFRSDTPA